MRCSHRPGMGAKSINRQEQGRTHQIGMNRRPNPRTAARTQEQNFNEMQECTGNWKVQRAQCVRGQSRGGRRGVGNPRLMGKNPREPKQSPENLPFTYFSVQQPLRPPLLQPNGKSNNQR